MTVPVPEEFHLAATFASGAAADVVSESELPYTDSDLFRKCLSATVSVRVLKAASRNSLDGFDLRGGTRPHRIRSSRRLPSRPAIVSIFPGRTGVIARLRVSRRLIQRESVQRNNFPS